MLPSLKMSPTMKEMAFIAWPLILANISIPLLGFVDTAVLGRLSSSGPLAAVGLASIIFSFLYTSLNFLRSGVLPFVAKAHGRKDTNAVATWLVRALLLALLCGVIILLLRPFIGTAAFSILQSETLKKFALQYYDIRILSAPSTLINFVCIGVFLGIKQPKAVLYSQIFLNVLNIILDIILVLKLDFGIQGAAWATTISEYSTSVLLVFFLARFYMKGIIGTPKRIFEWSQIIDLITVNRDLFIRTVCLVSANSLFIVMGETLGQSVLAANNLLWSFHLFVAFGLDGFANAAEILVGHSFGRQDMESYKKALDAVLSWAFIAAFVFSGVLIILGPFAIHLITNLPKVRSIAQHYYWFPAIMPFFSVWSFALDGVYIGAGAASAMRNSMIISLLVFLSTLALTYIFKSNAILWMSYTLFLSMRAITLYYRLPRLNKKIAGTVVETTI